MPFPVHGLRTIVAITSTVGMVCNMLPEAIAEQERLGLGAPRGARANGHVVEAVWRRSESGLLGSGLAV